MARVDLRNLSKHYPGVAALDDINLTIEPGEFFTLLGPSGCGKTTLLRMIAGFDLPDAGRILLNGEDLASRPPELRPVRTVFQSYALFPHMTVEGNVAFPLQMASVKASERPARIAAALEDVRLIGFGKRYPHELSGGQKQRVAIARALIGKPRLILADEPTGALDSETSRQIMDLLSEIHQSGITVLVVSHDSEVAARTQRIIRLKDGKVMSPHEMLSSTSHPGMAAAT